jgi:hypothetical protein
MFIIDFGCDMPMAEAAGYEAPFKAIETNVKPERVKNRRQTYAERWWIHVEPRPAMRDALAPLPRFIGTARLAKHRLFVTLGGTTLPDSQMIIFARSDDYFFGVLHSSIHELWALRMGTQLEDRPRYTPTTCFETFPLPWPPTKEPTDSPLYGRIAGAARTLNEQRERWLNPPEWLDEVAAAVDREDDFHDVPEPARGLIRQSAIMARAAEHPELKRRTLTALYNERPTWLRLAHQQLDRAVLAAYAATDPDGCWDESWADVWLDTGAGQPLPKNHALVSRRSEIDTRVLENLLRLNSERA